MKISLDYPFKNQNQYEFVLQIIAKSVENVVKDSNMLNNYSDNNVRKFLWNLSTKNNYSVVICNERISYCGEVASLTKITYMNRFSILEYVR